jgi:diacylglycerol kinase (ATP)
MLKAFRHIVYATGYSMAGVVFMLRSEISARIHAVVVILAVLWLFFLDRPLSNYLVLLMVACILFAFESFNTAIEVVVDKLSPEHSEFAKTVKDLGSAAVFFILSAGGLYLAAVTADAFGLVKL